MSLSVCKSSGLLIETSTLWWFYVAPLKKALYGKFFFLAAILYLTERQCFCSTGNSEVNQHSSSAACTILKVFLLLERKYDN